MMTAHELGCNFTEFSLEEKLKKKHQIFGFVCCVISYNRNHNHNHNHNETSFHPIRFG